MIAGLLGLLIGGGLLFMLIWNVFLDQSVRCMWGRHWWREWQMLDKKTTVDSNGIMTYYQSRSCRECERTTISIRRTDNEH